MKNGMKPDNKFDIIDLKFFVESNIFKLLKYIKSNGIYIVLIVAIGFGCGYYLDKKQGSEQQLMSSSKTKDDRLIKKQTAILFNYNSIALVDEWIDAYLHDEKLEQEGLVNMEIAELEPTLGSGVESEEAKAALTFINAHEAKEMKKMYNPLSTDFHYFQLVILAKEGFDFNLLLEDLSKRIESISHFSQAKIMQQEFLKRRAEEINVNLIKLTKVLERETIAPMDLIAVIDAKKALEEELITIETVQMQTSSILYRAYEINESDKLTENKRYNPDRVLRKKIQFPIAGLVLFFLGQWVLNINRKYTKNNG